MEKWKEYKFKIEAYTPDTLPMARCASYLTELSAILGETASVHFVKVASGCVQLVHRIDIDADQKVKEHTLAVAQGTGTDSQMRAYRRVNKMLLEDNGTGSLVQGKTKILQFPGKKEEFLNFSSIQQQGEIDGEVIRVGGSKDIVPILLEVEGREISGCHAKRSIAKDLAKNLFEPVRLFGEGKWDRSIDGEWKLIEFTVDRFDVLEESALSKTVIALRGLKGDWNKNSFNDLLAYRNYEDKH